MLQDIHVSKGSFEHFVLLELLLTLLLSYQVTRGVVEVCLLDACVDIDKIIPCWTLSRNFVWVIIEIAKVQALTALLLALVSVEDEGVDSALYFAARSLRVVGLLKVQLFLPLEIFHLLLLLAPLGQERLL